MKISTLFRKILAVACLFFCCLTLLRGQERPQREIPAWGIKTNLLYDATTTINLGAEFRLSPKTSLDLPLNWNPFTFTENRKWRHILVQPEFRYWTKETFSGHFFGLHAHYAFFNIGNLPEPASQYMRDHRFEGWLSGAGVSYGYRWNLSHRWALEATLGVGYAYLSYGRFESCPDECNSIKLADETMHYFGPTKAGLSLIYNIGKKKQKATAAPVPEYIPLVVVRNEPEAVRTPYTPQYAVSYVVPERETLKTRSETGKAYLDFMSGSSEILPSFKNNAAELQKIHSLIETVKNDPNATITAVTITGYASPEDTFVSNLTLSEKRAVSLKNHIRSIYGFSESLFTVRGKGEDWDTLDSLVFQSNMAEKYAVLAIIRGVDIFDGREKKLMDLSGGNPYREMKARFFPQLRRTEYQLHYTVRPFSVQTGIEVLKNRPSTLSLHEMFEIAQTYTPGSDEFNSVFETAARLYPRDDAANLNAAASALKRGNLSAAENYLSRVFNQTADYHNNMGVLYGQRGEWSKAAESFRRAHSAGNAAAGNNAIETAKAIESRGSN